ncbi:hypothetical protein E2L06_12330 [Haloterrigena sp. H1]|uniref:DUF5799 family protein n=1 Tax=Haloterrigena sp. H1 TaxID=2552943 RepID=UPI00110F013C|nr:DUF5799 family protein [Haloterrigena sp. H1]TMT87328.1 hypothetical protein E2L06_12330 [Haloterrigena sp. H1]
MSDTPWTDRIVGERMAVDQAFAERIQQSQFSNQQWSLIMTATEFEIEHPDDPEQARIVANTDKLEGIIPELENIQSGMGAMGGPGADRGGSDTSSGGLLDSIMGALGVGDDGSDDQREQREAAERLTQAYAAELQSHLESKGRWETVRHAATDGQ